MNMSMMSIMTASSAHKNQILSYSTTNRDGNREYKSKVTFAKLSFRERCTENQQYTKDRDAACLARLHSEDVRKATQCVRRPVARL